jgi:hypothetical protein
MSGNDRLGGSIGAKSARGSQPVLEPAVVGLDRVVRVRLDVVPCLRDELVKHRGVRRGGVSEPLPTSRLVAPLMAARVLVYTQAGDDCGAVLVEEQLEVVRRIFDVYCAEADGLFCVLA